jgi:SP family general alpha glucoside:H+ symporter-like MFS transporter
MYFIIFAFVFTGVTIETVSTTNAVFFAGKFINGFAVGAMATNSMTYIGEVSPQSRALF